MWDGTYGGDYNGSRRGARRGLDRRGNDLNYVLRRGPDSGAHDASDLIRLWSRAEAVNGSLDEGWGDCIDIVAAGEEDDSKRITGMVGIIGGAKLHGGGESAGGELVERSWRTQCQLECNGGISGAAWTRQQAGSEGDCKAEGYRGTHAGHKICKWERIRNLYFSF